ncbi:MAG: cell division protein FtsQ/DivIB [Lachnospiraceae bacterium]|nr:cell division protein FtsQ/DivIB [Lachnospiraceae bacterium]
MKKRIIVLVVILLAIIGIFAILFFGIKLKKVTVSGNKTMTKDEIISAQMSDKFSYNTIYSYFKFKFKGAKKMPMATKIEVSFKGIDTIVFKVYEKEISACVESMNQYAYMDKEGTVIRCMEEKLENVTVITGVGLKSFTVGKKLNFEDDGMFERVVNITTLIKHYGMNISVVNIEKGSVTLYTEDVTVLLGNKDFYDEAMAQLSEVLKRVEKKNIAGTIDMTLFEEGDDIVINPKRPGGLNNSTGVGKRKRTGAQRDKAAARRAKKRAKAKAKAKAGKDSNAAAVTTEQ